MCISGGIHESFFPSRAPHLSHIHYIFIRKIVNFFNQKKTDAGAFLGTVLFSSPQQQHHIQKNTVFSFLFAFFSSSSHFVTVKENFFVSLPPSQLCVFCFSVSMRRVRVGLVDLNTSYVFSAAMQNGPEPMLQCVPCVWT